MIKTLSKLVIEENFLNLTKNIYKKHTAATIANDEKQDAFPKIGNKTRISLSPILFDGILEVLANAVKLENENIQIGKEKISCLMYGWHDYLEDTNRSITKQALKVISDYSKVADYEVSIQKLIALNNWNLKLKIIPFTLVQKNTSV